MLRWAGRQPAGKDADSAGVTKLTLCSGHLGVAAATIAPGNGQQTTTHLQEHDGRHGMNGLLTLMGIESWKPILTALILPPVPFLLLVLLGARLILPRRGLGWVVIVFSVVGLWLGACAGSAELLNRYVLKPPAALSMERVGEIRSAVKAKQQVAIVVLGGGLEPLAPEYGIANLSAASLERLRYGLWLSKETGAPVLFSGGLGWAQRADSQSEARTAGRIAQQEFGRPLKWMEASSRDTRENAQRSVGMLKAEGITHIVLVTHGNHMVRARKVFEEFSAGAIRIQPASMGMATRIHTPVMEWMPTIEGFREVRRTLHELLGIAVGA
jgi:uncharacterized SAM-binding protein YcdF (DUF218 family)